MLPGILAPCREYQLTLPGVLAHAGSISSLCREYQLTPVIQAIGRPELWDGLRCNSLTTLAIGILYPHYDNSAVDSHPRRPVCSPMMKQDDSMQHRGARVRVLPDSRPNSQYCIALYVKNPKKKKIIIIIIIITASPEKCKSKTKNM